MYLICTQKKPSEGKQQEIGNRKRKEVYKEGYQKAVDTKQIHEDNG